MKWSDENLAKQVPHVAGRVAQHTGAVNISLIFAQATLKEELGPAEKSKKEKKVLLHSRLCDVLCDLPCSPNAPACRTRAIRRRTRTRRRRRGR